MALILRSSEAVTVNTIIIAGAHTAFFAISDISLFTFTCVRTMSIITDGMFVTVVQAEAALVNVGALCIGPSGVRSRYV